MMQRLRRFLGLTPLLWNNNQLMKKKTRNPVARSPLLKKGGPHEKSRSAERMKEKKALRSEISQTQRENSDTKK